MTPQEIAKILGQPIKLNKIEIGNRMVMGPMAANAPKENGGPSKQTSAFFEARARGGIGMIIAGGTIAATRGYEEAPFKPLLRFDIDDHIEQFREVADAVHKHNTPIIAEIMPAFGRMGVPGKNRPLISASPKNIVIPEDRFPNGILVPGGRITPEPREATIAEIQGYEAEMIEAAVRVQNSGWDGIEIAAHMSYFLASFLSPRTNWRSDEYGGSIENRSRILVNIVRGVRKRLGNDYLVGLRITTNDGMPDGQGTQKYALIAKEIASAGVDYVALSRGCYETMDMSAPKEDGTLTDDAAQFRELLSIPLLLQGLHGPANAAQAIASDQGDMIMFARSLLADPEYANKVTSGNSDSIIACDRANLCLKRLMAQLPMRCSVNPRLGREGGEEMPLSRIAKAPIEKAILGAMGSRTVMKVANKLTGGISKK